MKITLLTIASIFSLATMQAQTQFFGMTNSGGDYGTGTIFKTDNVGANKTNEKNLYKIDASGAVFNNFIENTDGMLYGMTNSGGSIGRGVLFQYNPITNIYTKKIDFNSNNLMGSYPEGTLCKANDGKFYATTNAGGVNNEGTLFQYDATTNVFVKKIDFDYATIGSYPVGSLIQATDGNLYGLTNAGGSNDKGVLFQYNAVMNSITVKFNFDGLANGQYPNGSLIQATDGNIYGMTSAGGLNSDGVVFQYNPTTQVLLKKVDFDGTVNGRSPIGSLMQASNGLLYGLTKRGGTTDEGVWFQYNTSNNTLLPNYMFNSSLNGPFYPTGHLMQATDGMLYALTSEGGANTNGTLMQYDVTTNTVTVKASFDYTLGINPYGSLMQASDGKLYGMTNGAGTYNAGTVFQFNTIASTLIKMVDFGNEPEGSAPKGSLLKASDDFLYGMASEGGTNNSGVIFKYDPSSKYYQVIYNFISVNGADPWGDLIEANNGLLYGLTHYGGANDFGVLFSFNLLTQTYTKLIDFDDTNNGKYPQGSLYQATDGMLYGTTSDGGINNKGTFFQFNLITNTLFTKHQFTGTDGYTASGLLVQASNGLIYGTTSYGGVGGQGNLFEYNPTTNVLTSKVDFSTENIGRETQSGLTLAPDGHLYGTQVLGGTFDKGTIYQYNITTNTVTLKFSMDDANTGYYPSGAMINGFNGKMYGLTQSGGVNSAGIIFEYDPITNNFTKKTDLDYATGSEPYFTHLVELALSLATKTVDLVHCANNTLTIPYSISGSFDSANVLNVELSDASGSFTSPTTIGSGTVSVTRLLAATIPSNTPAGSAYRIRVVSTNPVIVANNNGSNITINALPTLTVNSGAICIGQSFTINASGANTYTYSNGPSIITPTIGNTYSVTGTSIEGCVSVPVLSTLTVNILPSILVTTNHPIICAGETTTLSAMGASLYTWNTTSVNSVIAVSPTITTNYAVTGVDLNGCSNVATITQSVSLCTSIDDVSSTSSNGSFQIYPNPTNDILNIDLDRLNNNTWVEIRNALGQVLMSEVLQNQKSKISIQHFPKGLYFVTILNENTKTTRKVLVE